MTVDTVSYHPNLKVIGTKISGPYARAVLHSHGRLDASKMDFTAASATGDTVVRLGVDVASFRMSDCNFRANSGNALVIPSGVTGKVFMYANDLGAQTYTPPTTLPAVYKTGLNNGIPTANM